MPIHATPQQQNPSSKNCPSPKLSPGLNCCLILPTGVLLIAALLIFGFDPAQAWFYPPCPFRLITGLHCPGCGSLRAIHQLLHGRIEAAFTLNPLLIMALPAGVLFLLPRAGTKSRVWPGWFWLIGIMVIGFGVLRNLPFYPFTVLNP